MASKDWVSAEKQDKNSDQIDKLKNQENVPKLRFLEFNDEWKIYKLENLFDIKAAGDLDKNTFSNDCDRIFKYPLYANALTNKGLIGFSSIAKYPKNSLTVTARGDLGNAFVRKTKFNASGRLLILQQKVNLDLEFISNYINGKLNIFIENTGVPQLTAPNFKTYKIKMPILEEQQKIGRFLSLINEKIELMEKKYHILNNYKKNLIELIFTKKLKFRNFNNKWKYSTIEKIADIYGRIGFRGYTVSDLVKKGEGALTIGGKHINENGKLNLEDSEYISWEKYEESPEIKVLTGDILFVKTASVGKVCIVDKLKEPATVNPQVVIFKNIKINNKFLFYYLYSNTFQRKIFKIKTTTGIPSISQSELKKLNVSFPSLEEQKKIADVLSKIDNKIDYLEQQLEKIKEFKRYLLQQMFI